MEKTIECLNSWGDWVGSESWLGSTAEELHKHYRQLRNDIRQNSDHWSYSEYCERLAYHYFNLACYYNDELFNKYRIDLKSIHKYLQQCLEKLAEIPKEVYLVETKKLKNDAEQFLTSVKELYERQKSLQAQCSNSNIKKYIKLSIASGIVNQIPLQKCSNDNKQLIQNMLLLRVINTLENAITVSEYKNTFITAEQSDYLSQAYQLAGQFATSRRYKRTSDKLKKAIPAPKKQQNNTDRRQEIKYIVSSELEKHKSNLIDVKSYIAQKFNLSLSMVDIAFIESKYAKYCARLWLQKTASLLKELTESKSRIVIQDIFNSLDSVRDLSQIPNPFTQLEYYTLLMENFELIRKEDEQTLISCFKKECIDQILAYSYSAKQELEFLKNFVNFLSSSKNLQSIVAELELENFCCDNLSFDELVYNINRLEVDSYLETLKPLQEATESLKTDDLFLMDTFKEVLRAYTRPVKIQERNIDGRLVIEVIGKNIVVSQIVQRLEEKFLGNSSIAEVRFIGGDIVHVDADFEAGVWRGKNIVVFTKIIKVHEEVTWDVSGRDNDRIYSENAGTGEDGDGRQGNDGYPGESGGNVSILVESIENSEKLTIISNGGRGSKGQDGGNGKDGGDGVGITKVDLDSKFRSPVKLLAKSGIRRGLALEIFEKIKRDSVIIKDQHFFDGTCMSVFIESTTTQGNKVFFSFCGGGGFTHFQSFLLYKGSLGKPGGRCGEYGLGGQGGYAGEVIVGNPENSSQEFDIKKETKAAGDGEKGQRGVHGSHGKNGWDMGYLDYQFSKEAIFRGLDQNSKCTLEYYDVKNSPRDRVWCKYKNKYAGIRATNIEHKKRKIYEERNNTRVNSDRQHHALAVRKKNISQSSILANYSHHLSSIERSMLRDLQSDLESTNQRAMEAIVENQEQQEKQTMETSIKRHFPHHNISRYNRDIFTTTSNATHLESVDVDSLIDKLTKEPLFLANWDQLNKTELNLSQLRQLLAVFVGISGDNSALKDVASLLVDKYRLATLQEIAEQLPPVQEFVDNAELLAECAAKYLIEAKENVNNVSHPYLGTLNQYIYEKSEQNLNQILEVCGEESQISEILKRCMKIFVLEVGGSEKVHPCIKKYYKEYNELLQNYKQRSDMFFHVFISEIFEPGNADVFDLWIESFKDKFAISKLEEIIQKDTLLYAAYSRLKPVYDWNDCYNDPDIFREYRNHIQEKGLLSESYWELLALGFDINIRLYIESEDHKLLLQSHHNPLSHRIIHILCRDNKFVHLDVDKNYLKLEKERKMKDDLYEKILAEIQQLTQKQEFDDYLEKKAFLFKNKHCSGDDVENVDGADEVLVTNIIKFFPEEERQELKDRLDKITSPYIGRQGILQNMMNRFSNEGVHVSSQELYCLINSIISCVNDDRRELNVFSWIVAAYPQKSWTDEIILLQLENYFRKALNTEKTEWRKYLSKIENKDILLLFELKLDQHKSSNQISIQCCEDILRLLSNIPNQRVSLEGLGLSEWPYALKEKYWTCKLSKLSDWQTGDLPTASYYLLSLENIFGPHLAEKFIEALEKKQHKLSSSALTDILSNFHNEKWRLNEEELGILNSCTISSWTQKLQEKFTADKTDRKITQLVQLIAENANTSKEIFNNLQKIKDFIQSIDECVIGKKPTSSLTESDIKDWVKKCQDTSVKETLNKTLAVIDRAIELRRGYKLRDTQRLTVLALLTNTRSTLAQVSTGEGKSLIVVAVSIIKALYQEKVDIVTSSSVLAKRDAESNRDIYRLFGINVSHNCSEDIEKRKEAYSSNQVIYGDLSSFQRDYLLDKFYGKNILGDRRFENIIVDEVDSMLLDKGNNMLYLSHDIAGLDKLESVYLYIWRWIKMPARDNEELCQAFDVRAIREAVISDLDGLMKKEDIGELGSELSEQQRDIIWERLLETKILDGQGRLLKVSTSDNELNKILSSEFDSYKDRLKYLLRERFERERLIHVPNNLRQFIDHHLESWIRSAITAFCMKAGEDYVVDVDKTGTSSDRNPNITILDRDTGTDQANSQWDEALHQFLQLKHGCKLSLQSLKAVFISNVSFFKLYIHLYGLTGTLGSQRERDLLQEIHGVDFVTVPTAKSKQFHEDKPILCAGQAEWVNHICKEVEKQTELKRSVLIICETVNDVELLHKAFGGQKAQHVHTYTRDYEEFDRGFENVLGNKELRQGQIIIATNLAGRGTDIKITKELREEKGLHVCLTYLPNNVRVEQQAFGRAARNGDEGSGQLIIMNSKGQRYTNSKVLDLKRERDIEELHRVSSIKAYYVNQITTEENLFKSFKEQYELLQKELHAKKVPTQVEEILLQSCLDEWAFWLDEHSRHVRDLTDVNGKRNLHNLLDEFITRLKNLTTGYSEKEEILSYGIRIKTHEHDSTNWLAWVEGNPVQMIKLGKYLSQEKISKNAYENATRLFDEVIKKEPQFSEAAHYYKAYLLARKINWENSGEEDKQCQQEFKKELQAAARLFDEHSTFAINAAGIIGKIKENDKESILQIDAYEEQQKSLANLYYMFSQSIDDIFGSLITPQSFVDSYIGRELAETVYEDLLRVGVLRKPSVRKNVPEEDLKVVSAGYGVIADVLREFLSKYEGQEIIENDFQNRLKEEVQLPSREAFWKSLIEGEILSEEVKYVTVDNEKLKEIDPSLCEYLSDKVAQKELEKQTLEHCRDQIILYAEWITQQKSNSDVFKKNDFITIVGKDKYVLLKKRGVLSVNRKAQIHRSKFESIAFPSYDSITVEDFAKVNITRSDGERILEELVEQKVIGRKEGSNNNAYGLKIGFNNINQVHLSFCSVYESAVKGLLSACFAYRIALQRIGEQLDAKDVSVCIKLIMKPHHSLMLELLKQKVIRPTTVIEDSEEKLKNMYKQAMTRDQLKRSLSREKLIPAACTENLFKCLLEKGWVVKYDLMESAKEKGLGIFSKETIKNEFISSVEFLYCVNCPDKRNGSLSFYHEERNIDKTVNKVLDNLWQLAREDTIENIVSVLKRSKSSLEAIKVPDAELKPLTELCVQGNFGNIEEVHVFFLNGLDQLLQLGEKKWTEEMLWNTAKVVAIGVCQIAIGAAIELYSVGVMTHVGAACINEGVGDLFFACGSLMSGHFSWENYRQHKLVSLTMTAFTVGVGAFCSRGVKVSRFGHKLAGPDFEIGTKVAEMAGNKLIKTAGSKIVNGLLVESFWSGCKIVGKEVAKRIALKAIEGLAVGLANAGVDVLVQNHLQVLCRGIASKILTDIEGKIYEHDISVNVERTYMTLGRERAMKLIIDLTKSVFKAQHYVEELIGLASKLVNVVTKGMSEAVEKASKTIKKLTIPINIIKTVWVWLERIAHIGNIVMSTTLFLNSLNQAIESKIKKYENLTNNEKQKTKDDYKSFEKDVIDHWKSLLLVNASKIIEQHIVSPVLKEGATHLVKWVGRKIQEAYQSSKESDYFEQFEELKQKYNKNQQSSRNSDTKSNMKKHVTEKYHKDLMKLLAKTRNPKLFAALIRENIPMDITCVRACHIMINRLLEAQGNQRVSIVVEGEGGIRQVFSSASEGTEELTITIKLKDNHFQLGGSSQSNSNNESKNNCLFEALSESISLNMTAEEFRAKTANYIEQDPQMQELIKQGWHKFAISKGAFGGQRAYDMKIPVDELITQIKSTKVLFSQDSIGEYTSETGGRVKMHVSELADNIKKEGWKGDPVKAMKKGDKFVMLDHRRIVAATLTKSHDVVVPIAVYGEDDEFSSETCQKHYGTRKVGEAVKKRIENGNSKHFKGVGFVSSDVRIRIKDNSKFTDDAIKQLNDAGFRTGSRKSKVKDVGHVDKHM